MDDTEKEAMEAYKKEGVELPEAEPTEPEEKPAEEPKEEEEEDLKEEEPPVVPKKRSIYQDLKSSRKDAKSEKELREKAEQERDDLQTKLDAASEAKTPEEKKEATNDLESFAKEIDADPSALSKMRELFLKDLPKGEVPEELSNQLQEFQDWQKTNSEAVEIVQFDQEFKLAQPDLVKMFPKATAEEMETIKAEINKLAHTDAFHDKEIDYIAFKNQTALTALVSPQKRGLESKKKGDAPVGESFNFDPNADLSKLSPKEAEAWEKAYNKATGSESLQTNELGQKIII